MKSQADGLDSENSKRSEIVVDGEIFIVESSPSSTSFLWASGPNEGYGFSAASSGGDQFDSNQLEKLARSFLAQIDANIGYIEE